jgi:hypothetical protein
MKTILPITRTEALATFSAAPDDALFSQAYIAAYLDCSIAKMERDRWAGKGVPFVKIGRMAKYVKRDALAYRQQFQPQQSTSETNLAA